MRALWQDRHERVWRKVLAAIGWVTVVSGAVQLAAPAWELRVLDADASPTPAHFFRIVGMFMVLFGGLLLHGVHAPRENPAAFLWAGLQKLGASLMVGLAVVQGLLSPVALLVAVFDMLSAAVVLGYLGFLRNAARLTVAGRPEVPARPLVTMGSGSEAAARPLVTVGSPSEAAASPPTAEGSMLEAFARPVVTGGSMSEDSAHRPVTGTPTQGASARPPLAEGPMSEVPARPPVTAGTSSGASVARPPVVAADGRKRSLILAGGGMRVAWQAGVLRALTDAGLTFQHADGTSGGIINLAMMLSGLSPQEMCARWRTLRVRDFVSFVSPEKYLRAWKMEAMGDADGIIGHVFPHLGIDVDAIHAHQGLEGTFNVCDFTRKTNEVFDHTRVDLDVLVAGISLPIFMPPVRKGATTYTDSVWIQDANLLEAVRRGASELWVLWCIGNTPTYARGIFQQYVHMIEMSANGALFSQLQQIQDLNDRIRAGEVVMGHREPIAVHLIKPERPLPLDPDFYAGHITAASLIDMGYSDAWRYLAVASAEGLPLTPEMTQMTEPTPDLTFRETMSGPLAMGTTDPTTGAHQGKDTPFTMHCTISVDDMDAFVRDENHTARLVAQVHYAPLGEDLPVKQGTFNLFRPGDTPNTRIMAYGLRFAAKGKEYYLSGTKTIRDDAGPDLWKDTTRLYSRLHEGTDERGPVVAAGVLKLGVEQVLKIIASMRSGREGTAGVGVIGQFGKLFMGTLWDIYAPRARTREEEAPPRDVEEQGGEARA
ncbi:patatin-like phospholipase family protein [Pyxidicoccus xibeiensis]|uniref:patatin-like phospholipase family protein n=1 Tax=Pyxidicoccus xibeiensis TaxID=2906759 RepID=UPI0020A7122C|nr:patatin-like phospholipase family protein [Pyxidicoccus xibeiensis]MCP3139581.1 patatin-like phospholipase family protein [Pyxidicoccus xibeiensis]